MSIKTSQTEKKRGKRLKIREQSIQEQWDNYKRCNIPVMVIPERKKKKELKEQKDYLKQ